jgi:hypothetical protein
MYYDCVYAKTARSLVEFIIHSEIVFYVPAVVPTVLKIYQDLLGVRITSKKLAYRCVALAVLGMFSAVSPFTIEVQQLTVWDKHAED